MTAAPREFAVRFEPPNGSTRVPARVALEALGAVVEGLSGMRLLLAPRLADEHGWDRPSVEDALEIAFAPTTRGSYVQPITLGGSNTSIVDGTVHAAFWARVGDSLRAASRGENDDLSARCAEHFAKAGLAGTVQGIQVELTTRVGGRRRMPWTKTARLTKLAPKLRGYAQRRDSSVAHATAQLIGTVDTIANRDCRVTLITSHGTRPAVFPAALREQIHASWGKEVLATVEAATDPDGGQRDLRIVAIAPVSHTVDPSADFDKRFGRFHTAPGAPGWEELQWIRRRGDA